MTNKEYKQYTHYRVELIDFDGYVFFLNDNWEDKYEWCDRPGFFEDERFRFASLEDAKSEYEKSIRLKELDKIKDKKKVTFIEVTEFCDEDEIEEFVVEEERKIVEEIEFEREF